MNTTVARSTVSQKPSDRREYTVNPSDIDARECARLNFFETFGRHETESSAWWIVRFCQTRGSWEPFSFRQIASFFIANGGCGRFTFNGLVSDEFVVLMDDGLYRVTEEFVLKCHGASPMHINGDF